jgi:mono/diheme cytochrome c family protein
MYKYPSMASSEKWSEEVKEGEVIFMKYCHSCHPDGEAGLGPSIYYLPAMPKKFQVRHGLGVMPAFKKELISKNDLNKIMKYLKALKKEN